MSLHNFTVTEMLLWLNQRYEFYANLSNLSIWLVAMTTKRLKIREKYLKIYSSETISILIKIQKIQRESKKITFFATAFYVFCLK